MTSRCRVAIYPDIPDDWPDDIPWTSPIRHNWKERKRHGELIPLYVALAWFRKPDAWIDYRNPDQPVLSGVEPC
jgi:hypothetical protein